MPPAEVEWRKRTEKLQAKAAKLGIVLTSPATPPPRRVFEGVTPALAADGRADVATIELVRGRR